MNYTSKKKREELRKLSVEVFGTRGRWYKFVQRRGYTLDQIEQQMLKLKEMIDAQKEQIKVARDQARQRKAADSADATGSDT